MLWNREAERLEEMHADRGLQFTAPFEGLSLMQAYGYLDGKRFYFNLRNGNASLCVGVYDRQTEMQKLKRLNEEPDSVFGYVKTVSAPELPKENDAQLFPSVVLEASRIESSREPLVSLFCALIENLEPVKQANWN